MINQVKEILKCTRKREILTAESLNEQLKPLKDKAFSSKELSTAKI